MSEIFLTSVISETVNFTLKLLSISSTKINPLNESQDSIVSGPDSSLISVIGTENTFEIIFYSFSDIILPLTLNDWEILLRYLSRIPNNHPLF